LAFSQDGQILLSGGSDRKLKFWDVTTQAPLEQLSSGGQGIVKIRVFSGGKLIAAKIFNKVAVWDAEQRKPLFTHFLGVDCQVPRPLLEVIQDEPVVIIGHSMEPDSEIAAATLDALTSTKMFETVPCVYRTPLNGTILDMVLSFDGKFLLCVGYGSHGQQMPRRRHAFLSLLDAHKGVVCDVKDDGKSIAGDSDYPLCVAASPTDSSFACGLQGGEYSIWTMN
jgi:WD40 repeat protein